MLHFSAEFTNGIRGTDFQMQRNEERTEDRFREMHTELDRLERKLNELEDQILNLH